MLGVRRFLCFVSVCGRVRGGAGGKRGVRGRFKVGGKRDCKRGKGGEECSREIVERRGLFHVTRPSPFLWSMSYLWSDVGGARWIKMGRGEEGQGKYVRRSGC